VKSWKKGLYLVVKREKGGRLASILKKRLPGIFVDLVKIVGDLDLLGVKGEKGRKTRSPSLPDVARETRLMPLDVENRRKGPECSTPSEQKKEVTCGVYWEEGKRKGSEALNRSQTIGERPHSPAGTKGGRRVLLKLWHDATKDIINDCARSTLEGVTLPP